MQSMDRDVSIHLRIERSSLIVSFYKNHSSKILPNPQKLLKTNKKESIIQGHLQSRPSLNSVPEGQGVLKF